MKTIRVRAICLACEKVVCRDVALSDQELSRSWLDMVALKKRAATRDVMGHVIAEHAHRGTIDVRLRITEGDTPDTKPDAPGNHGP